MKYIPLFYATLFCISLAPFSRGVVPTLNLFNFSPTPSLGASPILDTTALKLSRQMDVFSNKLLSSESRNLAQLATSGQDFRDWKNNVLARFKIRQSTLPRYSANDKTSDLRQFTRYLNALESEFQEEQTQSRLRSVTKQRQRGFNYSMQLLQKAVQKYQIAGDQYHDLQAQQADLFSSCAEIGGASGAPNSYDPYSGEGYLVNLLSPGGNIGNVLNQNAIQVKVKSPSNWQFPYDNYGCIGPIVFANQLPPLDGYIDTRNNRDSYFYPDRSSKLGVLYDKIVDLCYDYINDGSSNSDYNDRVLLSLKSQWSDLVMKYSKCVVKYNQLGKKLASVQGRLATLSAFIQGINNPPSNPQTGWLTSSDPQTGWQNSFTNSHSSSFGPGSELSLGNLQNILIG